jgi:hypothetical protein
MLISMNIVAVLSSVFHPYRSGAPWRVHARGFLQTTLFFVFFEVVGASGFYVPCQVTRRSRASFRTLRGKDACNVKASGRNDAL